MEKINVAKLLKDCPSGTELDCINYDAFYIVGGSCWKQCIPYLNNEHLCGTTNDCDDFYKTWEE